MNGCACCAAQSHFSVSLMARILCSLRCGAALVTTLLVTTNAEYTLEHSLAALEEARADGFFQRARPWVVLDGIKAAESDRSGLQHRDSAILDKKIKQAYQKLENLINDEVGKDDQAELWAAAKRHMDARRERLLKDAAAALTKDAQAARDAALAAKLF